jgi:hypothetical protein
MGSKRRGLFTSLMDQNLPCKYLGRILERWSAGLTTSIWQCDRVLPVLRDSFKNWSQALILLLRLGYCPLTGYKPGLLLASLPDLTPWEASLHNGAYQ